MPSAGHSAGGLDAAGSVSVEFGIVGGADQATVDTGTAATADAVGGAASTPPGSAKAGWSDRVPTSTPISGITSRRTSRARIRARSDVYSLFGIKLASGETIVTRNLRGRRRVVKERTQEMDGPN
ncbi:hypothetical protein GCM10009682_62170 [Luedemannella flava]|uniref:Uncharacterized protein n=1 Tax=Luedemannella flava TaxID=349316 RepID=A0ABP4YZD1_9ACTN